MERENGAVRILSEGSGRMKTMRALLGCGLGLMLWGTSLCEGAPSLSVTKPPVQLPTLMTGPPVDPTAAQGQ